MKIRKIFPLLFLAILGFVSCGDDDDLVPEDQPVELSYDGANVTAPLLEPGEYELAARFANEELSSLRNRKLSAVQFFMGPKPPTIKVRVSGPGTATEPGNILYEFDLSNNNSLQEQAFNELPVDPPLELPSEMWLSVFFTVEGNAAQNIGCDGGPADPNGDFVYDSNVGVWETWRQRTNGNESVNWNLRAVLTTEE